MLGFIFNFKNDLSFERSSIYWWGFIIISLTSAFWALDPSKSLFMGFGILGLYLIALMQENSRRKYSLHSEIQFIGVLGFTILSFWTLWSLFSGNFESSIHRNVLAQNLCCLFPFALFYKISNRLNYLIKGSLILLVFTLLILTHCRGAILAFIIILCIWYCYEQQVRWSKIVKLIAILLPLGIIVFTVPFLRDKIIEWKIISEFFKATEFERVLMLRNSFWLFLESPIWGIGSGNWMNQAYKVGYESFLPSNNSVLFIPQENHMLYSTVLSETGIIGFVSLLCIFFLPLARFIYNFKERSREQIMFGCVLISFLVFNLFFRSTWFERSFFSPVIIPALYSLVYMNPPQVSKRFAGVKEMLLLSTIFSILFMSYRFHRHYRLETLKVESSNTREYLNALRPYYKNLINSQHRNSLFSHTLGRLADRKGFNDEAEKYLSDAASIEPYNVNILYDYSVFLLREAIDTNRAVLNLEMASKIHPKNFLVRLELADIAISRNEYDKALEWMSFFDREKFNNESLNRLKNNLNEKVSRPRKRNMNKYIEVIERGLVIIDQAESRK